ncbi:MAG: site-specific DNA-methyltransferase, partial [Treponemataceae bacterium]|nr:site-specific DNA-methyltransferase [Treponemataceae bacterium]
MKSKLNKTLDISVEEGKIFFDRCIRSQITKVSDLKISELTDKTINGDTFTVLKELPKKIADLAIIDPPYNLT